nr:4'-phosphopantetheinyl transferase superfamily protein [uncultured Pseudomonas sp.]
MHSSVHQLGRLPGGPGAELRPVRVFMWPGAPARWQNGILLIGLRHAPGIARDTARVRVRQAVSEALQQLLEVPRCRIDVHSPTGHAPQIHVQGHSDVGLSISHDRDFSVAAVHMHGPVGVDVMAVQNTPDWQSVTSDYLGPHVMARLCAASQAQRAHLFTRAWCEHEARLKCAGLALSEWSPQTQRAACIHALALPAGLVGALAVPA